MLVCVAMNRHPLSAMLCARAVTGTLLSRINLCLYNFIEDGVGGCFDPDKKSCLLVFPPRWSRNSLIRYID